jgi:hypothetical protein
VILGGYVMDKMLMEGVRERNKQKIQEAINNGVDINVKAGMMGESLLHCYVLEGDMEAAKLLIDMGADVNQQGNTGGTPLHSAAGNNDLTMVKYLINMGADLNKSLGGFTPLTVAVNRGYEKIAEVLIESGADVSADGGKALELAHKKGLSHLVTLLSQGNETYTRQEYKQLIVSDQETPNDFDEASLASFIKYISVVVLGGYKGLSIDGYAAEENLETTDFFESYGLETFIKLSTKDTFIYGNSQSKVLITYQSGMPYITVEHYSGKREIFNRLTEHEVWGVFEVKKVPIRPEQPKSREPKEEMNAIPPQSNNTGCLIYFAITAVGGIYLLF